MRPPNYFFFKDAFTGYKSLVILTTVMGLIVLFCGLGDLSLMSLNEGRRALAVKEMFSSGDWLLPHLNGELYLAKPPLLYWISTGLSHLIGHVNEWSLRLPSALSALAVLWMIYHYTFDNFGKWPALFSIQLLLCNAGFVMLARRAEIEMLLTALCLGALLSAVIYIKQGRKRWICLSYLLLGLAILTKGPVALIFVVLPLAIIATLNQTMQVRSALFNWQGWLILLIVGLSWYAIVTWQLGFDIWAATIKRDVLEKMQSEVAKPVLSYLGWILVDFLFLVAVFAMRPKALFLRYKDQLTFLIPTVAAVLPLLIFSIFSNKHEKYMLPVYPLITIVLAAQINLIFERSASKVKTLIISAGIILPLSFVLYYVMAEARIFNYRVAIFPEFKSWTAKVPEDELYAYGNIDSRLIFYSSKPVHRLNMNEYLAMLRSKNSMLMLIDGGNAADMMGSGSCLIKEFKPYLKRHKSLAVIGNQAACTAVLKHI